MLGSGLVETAGGCLAEPPAAVSTVDDPPIAWCESACLRPKMCLLHARCAIGGSNAIIIFGIYVKLCRVLAAVPLAVVLSSVLSPVRAAVCVAS